MDITTMIDHFITLCDIGIVWQIHD